MWKVDFMGSLPEKFELWSDEDFLYLIYNEEVVVAIFSIREATKEAIERNAKDYLDKI